jgi:hypothetical protein
VALKYLDAGKPQGVLGKSRTAGAVEGQRWKLGSAPEHMEHGALRDGWPFRVSEIDAIAALADRSPGEESYG